MPDTDLIACQDCGAMVPAADGPTHRYLGASPGCWAAFNDVLAKEFSDLGYYKAHQFTVDAYAAQHPGVESPQTVNSVAIHLISLYLIFERGHDPDRAVKARQFHVKRGTFHWLTPPPDLGAMTVLDVAVAPDADAHCSRVADWAAEVWRAWSPHHDTVREWVARAS